MYISNVPDNDVSADNSKRIMNLVAYLEKTDDEGLARVEDNIIHITWTRRGD